MALGGIYSARRVWPAPERRMRVSAFGRGFVHFIDDGKRVEWREVQ